VRESIAGVGVWLKRRRRESNKDNGYEKTNLPAPQGKDVFRSGKLRTHHLSEDRGGGKNRRGVGHTSKAGGCSPPSIYCGFVVQIRCSEERSQALYGKARNQEVLAWSRWATRHPR